MPYARSVGVSVAAGAVELAESRKVMFDFAIIPYRTLSFAGRFGFTVRDLMMLRALEETNSVSSIAWFERPSLALEGIIHRRKKPDLASKTTNFERTVINPVPAILRHRLWSADALHLHDRKLKEWSTQATGRKILLDFHPFYIPDEALLDQLNVIYWYDLIDNFIKHNVYTIRQREAVKRKYDFVRRRGGFVTGVSDEAVSGFAGGITLPNHLVRSQWMPQKSAIAAPAYDFGFTGFITDKFDIPFVRRLAGLGYRILIRGKAYHKQVAAELAAIDGVEVAGEFHSADQPAIIRQFAIGLIPYIPERCHEESPIKLIQYLASGRPALLSKKFGEIESEFSSWIEVYAGLSDEDLHEKITSLKKKIGDPSISDAVKESDNIFWDSQIEKILKIII